jgi:hypothetical protein
MKKVSLRLISKVAGGMFRDQNGHHHFRARVVKLQGK